ncbi:MAG: transglycosylase SLT domain-containing protein [Gemmatimonadetes bacterium]|uniref:Transglycosylase SLT domain-containing protein n=1 Tax=Candidatus Kutchimonas denitrificans TaxID=3056748 RepID=A0AAE4ZBS8_9BACT|nr:transglycosylase SLT domain-containing protein [Gemmatimonadota bacterium]NIR76447.1 transglycosylase SLT domain-containing protein [Candidatus Kutchimonas denitrificans]NIS03265.1 transglycosylase SLT domain-containing protein [Gemmatimonadota bacterium]NIT69126.1 transglycosylase SLT domain-containing protein [Gemmatimonadota bacterium]NIU54518.1 transglycosylase SLT domain-containing protein [Gemmatimonadota bacterium]
MRTHCAWIVLIGAAWAGCAASDSERDDATEETPPAVSWDIPIEVNEAVERWLDYYTTDGRRSFQITLSRVSRYERLMRGILRDAGLPEDLVYLPLIESGFETTAYSRARALGLWQFVPNTARIYDLEISRWVDERLDPIASTHAAADYLGDLHREFDDWYLTFAAYNAGPGRVRGAIRRTGSRDFWTLADRRALPRESRNYVPKLIAVALIAKQPEEYSVRRLYKPIVTFDVAYVPDATSLDVVADAAGVPLEEILELNRHLLRGVTPPGRRYEVRIPAGTPRIFAENYDRLPPSERVRSVVHIVRRGETLGRIARTYGVDLSAIRAANDGLDPTRLQAGQRLFIPGARNLPGLTD